MYAVRKARGSGAVITVVNTDKGSSVIIGKPTMTILEMLDKEGYSPRTPDPAKHIELRDEWDIEVTEEFANELARRALTMKRPPRRTKTEQDVKRSSHDSKEPVDLFDLVFGIKDDII